MCSHCTALWSLSTGTYHQIPSPSNVSIPHAPDGFSSAARLGMLCSLVGELKLLVMRILVTHDRSNCPIQFLHSFACTPHAPEQAFRALSHGASHPRLVIVNLASM